MKRELALQLLRKVLPESTWDEDRFQKTFAELGVLARLKFDRYEMFEPGRLFFENLYAWLLRFEEPDRSDALEFVRNQLIFVSREEFEQLTGVVYHDQIRQSQFDVVSEKTGLPRFNVRRIAEHDLMHRVRRSSLFVAMSDGARIDYFRRQNLDITNEQVLPSYDASESKVADVLSELRKDLESDSEFECLYLIDDFSASGRTLLREVVIVTLTEPIDLSVPVSLKNRLKFNREKSQLELSFKESGLTMKEKRELTELEGGRVYQAAINAAIEMHDIRETQLKGSLVRLAEHGLFKALADDARIFMCPSLITQYALERLTALIPRLNDPRLANLKILPGAVIEDSVRISHGSSAIATICDKYYSADLGDDHTGSVKFGYDNCGLPVVLHHNTPNNSIYVLWSRRWRNPLFARYERHGRKVA